MALHHDRCLFHCLKRVQGTNWKLSQKSWGALQNIYFIFLHFLHILFHWNIFTRKNRIISSLSWTQFTTLKTINKWVSCCDRGKNHFFCRVTLESMIFTGEKQHPLWERDFEAFVNDAEKRQKMFNCAKSFFTLQNISLSTFVCCLYCFLRVMRKSWKLFFLIIFTSSLAIFFLPLILNIKHKLNMNNIATALVSCSHSLSSPKNHHWINRIIFCIFQRRLTQNSYVLLLIFLFLPHWWHTNVANSSRRVAETNVLKNYYFSAKNVNNFKLLSRINRSTTALWLGWDVISTDFCNKLHTKFKFLLLPPDSTNSCWFSWAVYISTTSFYLRMLLLFCNHHLNVTVIRVKNKKRHFS